MNSDFESKEDEVDTSPFAPPDNNSSRYDFPNPTSHASAPPALTSSSPTTDTASSSVATSNIGIYSHSIQNHQFHPCTPDGYKDFIWNAPSPTQFSFWQTFKAGINWVSEWGMSWWCFNIFIAIVSVFSSFFLLNVAFITSSNPFMRQVNNPRFPNMFITDRYFLDFFWFRFFTNIPLVLLSAPIAVSYYHAMIKRILYESRYTSDVSDIPVSPVESHVPTTGDWFYGFSHMYLKSIQLGVPVSILIFIGYSFYILPGIYLSIVLGCSYFLLAQWGNTTMSIMDIFKIAIHKVNRNIFNGIIWILFSFVFTILGLITLCGWIAFIPALTFTTVQLLQHIFGFKREFVRLSPGSLQEQDNELDIELQ